MTDASRLGDYFTSRRERGTEGLPTLSVTLDRGLVPRDDLDRKMTTNLTADQHLRLKTGDIAYNMMRMWQGASGLADQEAIVSPAYIVLATKSNADPLYASYRFKAARMIHLFWAYSYGLTSDRLRLYFNDFKRIPAEFPPLPEQKKIAKILSTWDKAIETTEKLLDNATRQKRALMQQLLTGKRRFPEFEGVEWREVKLGEMGQTVSGGTPDSENSEYWDGKVLWATPTDITKLNSRFISDTKRRITEKGLKNSSAKLVPTGSLLICTRATIGEMAISKAPISTNQGFKTLVFDNEYDSDFVYYLLQLNKHQLIRYACGSTFLELSKRDFDKRVFLCPELAEQKRIAQVINNAETEIERLANAKITFKNEKKALMQQLLTGKRQVTV